MNAMMKSLGVLVAAVVVCAAQSRADDKPATKSSTPTLEDLFPDPVAVRGKGFEIKRNRFDEDVINIKADALSKGREFTRTELTVVERQVLDRLILDNILLTKATDADKAKGKADGDKQFEEVKKAEPNEETLIRKLKAVGLTEEKLHTRLIEKAIVQSILRAKATVTDADVKKFYDENPSKFQEPEMVKVSYILKYTANPKTGAPLTDEQKKANKKTLEDVLKRARAGEDFTKLAREFSDDSSVSVNGGEITFPRNTRTIPPEFEAAAFSLKTNQISDIVSTMTGYSIIKLHENIPSRRVPLSDDTKKRVEDYLVQVQIEKILPTYYSELKKEANVEILDADLKAIEDIPAAETSLGSTTAVTNGTIGSPK